MRDGKGGMADIATCVAPTGNAVGDLAMAHDQRDGFRGSDASRDRAIPQAMRDGKGGMVDIATCVAPTGNAVGDLAPAHDQRDGFRGSDASRDCPNHPAAFITT